MFKGCVTLGVLVNSICLAAGPEKPVSQGSVPVSLPRYENDIFVEADFIYWKAQQNELIYAGTGAALTVPGTIDPNTTKTAGPITGSGKLYSLNPHMKPGYKVGMGLNLNHGQWDLFAEYTYIHSHAHISISSNDINTGIIPFFRTNMSSIFQTHLLSCRG